MPAVHGHIPLLGIAAQAPAVSKAANGSNVILSHQRSRRRSRISFQPQAAGASANRIAARPRPCSAKSPMKAPTGPMRLSVGPSMARLKLGSLSCAVSTLSR